MNELINLKDSIFDSNDLYISAFISNSSTEYFLLYKNFESRNIAQDFCEKYTYFVDKCLIVNVKNLQFIDVLIVKFIKSTLFYIVSYVSH